MTIDDKNTPIPEPTDEELAEIEQEFDEDLLSISEEEYEDNFGDMPTTDKGLGGALWRERLEGANNFYNNPDAKGFLK